MKDMRLPWLQLLLFCLYAVAVVQSSVDFFGGVETTEYVSWFEDLIVPYEHSSFLSSSQTNSSGIAIHWTIEDDRIRMGIAAKAVGWVGFGISESGGMKGSDVVMFSAETEELVDSYVLENNGVPNSDDCQSWQLESSFVGNAFIIFEASRPLDSHDAQDKPFLNDHETFTATRVIGAWGDSPEPSFHGDNYAKGAVRFFRHNGYGSELDDFRSSMNSEAEGTFKVGATNFLIPNSTRTTYGEFCVSTADLLSMNVPLDTKPLHIIGAAPYVDQKAAPHVHHFLVFGSTDDCNVGRPAQELVFGWSPGVLPLKLPPMVGIPLGGDGGYVSFRIQIHYDNAIGATGIVDNSGIYAYYTSSKRDHDLGILQIGDPFVATKPEVLSEAGGASRHSFECSGSCTNTYFQNEVTVFAETIHMHVNGRMGKNEVVRNSSVVHSATAEFFDFAQQGGIFIQQEPFIVQPGDGFRLTCSYDADVGERWGTNSDDEMCIGYMFYYPRQIVDVGYQLQPTCAMDIGGLLPGCEATHSVSSDSSKFERVFGSFGSAGCPSSVPNTTKTDPLAALLAALWDLLG